MPHVGMLVQGRIAIEYADGCREEFAAPAAVVVVPGHDGWVVGDEPAVLVQYDCAPATPSSGSGCRPRTRTTASPHPAAENHALPATADTSNGGR